MAPHKGGRSSDNSVAQLSKGGWFHSNLVLAKGKRCKVRGGVAASTLAIVLRALC